MSKKNDDKKRSAVGRPVSLDPLDFEEALRALLEVKPDDPEPKTRKPRKNPTSDT